MLRTRDLLGSFIATGEKKGNKIACCHVRFFTSRTQEKTATGNKEDGK